MANIGPMEIAILLVVALIVLGPRRLPNAGRALGQGMREFKDSISGVTEPTAVATSNEIDAETT